MQSIDSKENIKKGIIMMLISALGFASMSIFVRLAGDYPLAQKAVFRSVIITVISGVIFYKKGNKLREIKHRKILTIRVIAGTLGILANYYAIDHLLLSDANVIFRISSVLVIIFSYFFLGEKINKLQIIASIIAFIGVIVVAKPAFDIKFIPYLVAFFGACVAAVAYTALRAMKDKISPYAIVFVFSLFSTCVFLPLAMINFQPMPMQSWFYLIMAGVGASVGQYGITLAYKFAPAKKVSIYNYYGLVFVAILSAIFLGEMPAASNIFGYLLIFGSSYALYKFDN